MRDVRDATRLFHAIKDAQLKYGCTVTQAADTVEAWRKQGYDPTSTEPAQAFVSNHFQPDAANGSPPQKPPTESVL